MKLLALARDIEERVVRGAFPYSVPETSVKESDLDLANYLKVWRASDLKSLWEERKRLKKSISSKEIVPETLIGKYKLIVALIEKLSL